MRWLTLSNFGRPPSPLPTHPTMSEEFDWSSIPYAAVNVRAVPATPHSRSGGIVLGVGWGRLMWSSCWEPPKGGCTAIAGGVAGTTCFTALRGGARRLGGRAASTTPHTFRLLVVSLCKGGLAACLLGRLFWCWLPRARHAGALPLFLGAGFFPPNGVWVVWGLPRPAPRPECPRVACLVTFARYAAALFLRVDGWFDRWSRRAPMRFRCGLHCLRGRRASMTGPPARLMRALPAPAPAPVPAAGHPAVVPPCPTYDMQCVCSAWWCCLACLQSTHCAAALVGDSTTGLATSAYPLAEDGNYAFWVRAAGAPRSRARAVPGAAPHRN